MNYCFIYNLNDYKYILNFYVYSKKGKKLYEFSKGKLIYNQVLSLYGFESIFNVRNGWKVIPIFRNKINDIKILSRFNINENEVLKKLELYEWQI